MAPVAVGVDVGQKRDPTAVAVLEVQERARSADENGPLDDYFVVRYLERLALGTSYPDVAHRVAGIAAKLDERAGQRVRPSIYLDATGVGQPVVDLLTAAGVDVTPVYFTHGDRCSARQDGTVVLGKALLVSQLQVLLQSGRILLPRTMEARVLADELLNFELRVDEKANEIFGAFKVGTHDDLVSALGLAVMAGQRRGRLPFGWLTGNDTFRGQVLGAAAFESTQSTQPAAAPALEGERWVDTVHGRLWRRTHGLNRMGRRPEQAFVGPQAQLERAPGAALEGLGPDERYRCGKIGYQAHQGRIH